MSSSSDMKSLARVRTIVGASWRQGRYAAVVALWLALTACSGGGGGGGGGNSNLTSVGGFITGLNGTIALRNEVDGNPGSTREFSNIDPLQTSVPFALPPRLSSNQKYNIVVVSQPQAQVCTVVNGSGTYRGSAITDIVVNCVDEYPLTLTLRSAKIFRFTWDPVPGATDYHLYEKPDAAGAFGRDPIASFGPDDNEYEMEVFLPARISASYILEYCDDDGCENSSPVFVSGTLDEAIGYVKASNTGANDQFGFSMALSEDGGTLAVGAPFEDSDPSGPEDGLNNSGAVYIYTRTALGKWERQARLKASNASADDQFGHRVVLSADGDTLAVGTPYESDGLAESGAVYVFRRDEGTWTERQKLKAANAGENDWFGWSVALSADGTVLATGAPFEGDLPPADPARNSGAVYVFADNGTTWLQESYLKAPDPRSNDQFGLALDLSADGRVLVVGAPLESVGASNSGAVYVYEFDGNSWGAPVYVKAPNADPGDWFGYSVALSGDGSVLVVGAPYEDSAAIGIDGDQASNAAPGSGAVYVYVRNAVGQWGRDVYLKASNAGGTVVSTNPNLGDVFGFAIALADDGDVLVVGAYAEDSAATGIGGDQLNNGVRNSGAAYVFRRVDGGWVQQAYVKAPNPDVDDVFGDNLALSGDGAVLAVGAPYEDGGSTGVGGAMNNAVTDSGAVYLY